MNKKFIAVPVIAAFALTGCVTRVAEPKPAITEKVVSQSCLDALMYSEKVVSITHEALEISGDALTAATMMSASGMDSATTRLGALKTPLADAVAHYNASAGTCRSLAKSQ